MMTRYLLVAAFCFLWGTTYCIKEKSCSSKAADIYFLLDSSSSIWIQDYKELLQFVSNVVDTFDIGTGQSQVRVGIITFSDTAHLDIPLNRYTAIATLKEAISQIPYRTGLTNTAAALNLLRREIIADPKGHDGPIVAIVITDGLSRDTKATKEEAEKLHSLGVNVYAIGVGNRYEIEELKSIASDAILGVYQVVSYSALEEIAHNFHIQPCKDIPDTTPMTMASSTTTTAATTTIAETTTSQPATTLSTTTIPTPKPTMQTTRETSTPKITSEPTTTKPTTTIHSTRTWVPQPISTRSPFPAQRPVWQVLFWPRPHFPNPSVIAFGFDLLGLGQYKSQMIYDFIANFLPISGYNQFSIVSQAYCPQNLNVPLSSMPKDLSGGPRNFRKTKLTFPSLEDTVRRIRYDMFRLALHSRFFGQMPKQVVTLFLEPSVTSVSETLIEEIEKLKMQGTELFFISIDSDNGPYTNFLNTLASDPTGHHVFEIPNYEELVSKIQHSPFHFRSLCNGYMHPESN
ncbi:Hypothetical predicted protein [Octopus vulgaris]|uniref:Uncharacterized protein n=2 Tax=Octopus TaxID=6643 RepID=A0AA36ASR5_OCTVU|nr:uncharacterized protein LOC115210485 [Octopus sinensis]CAI9721419.1 Hypothetical predicted protein [Octopus vulgaris]